MKIDSLDHLVLTVRNLEKTCVFYTTILGMKVKEFKPGRFALHFGTQKINLHVADKPVDPNVRHATPGSADLCFLTSENLDSLFEELKKEELKKIGVAPFETGTRTGAQGPIRSFYLYDPDENLIEIANQI